MNNKNEVHEMYIQFEDNIIFPNKIVSISEVKLDIFRINLMGGHSIYLKFYDDTNKDSEKNAKRSRDELLDMIDEFYGK